MSNFELNEVRRLGGQIKNYGRLKRRSFGVHTLLRCKERGMKELKVLGG